MGISAVVDVTNQFFSSPSPLSFNTCTWPCRKAKWQWSMKSACAWIFKKLSSSLCALTLELKFYSQPWKHWGGWKGWGRCKLKAMELAFCPLFQAGAILKSRHQKENSACAELKLDKMWWGTNEKSNKKRGGKGKEENGLSLPEGALFWKLLQIIALSTLGSFQEALHCT